MATATWKRDARKFGRLFKFGQWESALLVARSVRMKATAGKPSKLSAGTISDRATPQVFADEADVSRQTIDRYYETWQKAAKDHLVPDAKDLGPNEEPELPAQASWSEYYQEVEKRHPTRDRGRSLGTKAIEAGIDFNAALERAIESGTLTADEAREIDEVLADTHDLLQKVTV